MILKAERNKFGVIRGLLLCLTGSFLFPITVCAQPETALPAAQPVVVPEVAAPAQNPDTISLDFKDADINTVLRVMSMKSNVNIVAGPEVKGVVTIRLENVPWQKALEVVLRTYDYVYERDGNIIRVTTRDKMAQEPVATQTVVLNYTKAQEVLDAVKDILSERGRIKTADRTNALVVTDIPSNLYRISTIIKDLDKVTPQAFIDSKVVKTDSGLAENIGIDWSTGGESGNLGSLTGSSRPSTFPWPSGGKNYENNISQVLTQFFPVQNTGAAVAPNVNNRDFPLAGLVTPTNGTFKYGTIDFSAFSAILQLLKTQSNTRVESNPRIVVLNNQKAKVQVGDQIPIPSYERNSQTGKMEVTGYTFREIGVVLNVTPHINSQEEILVEVEPEVSSRKENVKYGDFEAPSFAVTTAKTQVLIQSGQTIAIGGLMSDSEVTTQKAVPYLSDIPLFGKIFRSKRQMPGTNNAKVETLFFITVTSVDTQGQPLTYQLNPVVIPGTNTASSAGATPKDADTQGANKAQTSEKSDTKNNEDTSSNQSSEKQQGSDQT
jgi:type IV pilus assembly protein PilQ